MQVSTDTQMRQARTLVQLLERKARVPGPFFEYQRTPAVSQSLEDLYAGAARWAGRLRELGVSKGDRVAVAMLTKPEVLESFFGVLMCRGAVVPLCPPNPFVAIQPQLERLVASVQLTRPSVLVFPRKAIPVVAEVLAGFDVLTVPLEECGEWSVDPEIGENHDLAVLQHTSGSMGRSRAVVLTHANILANLHNIVRGLELGPDDRGVSWLPLHHDMGLVGMVLSMICGSTRTTLIPPETFVVHPVRWLETLSRFGGTISTAPNFGYQLCVDRVRDEALEKLDLSHWRRALNGAEPVRPKTLDAFARRFAHCGFRRRAFLPVYGLAEASLAVAFPPLGREPLLDCVDPGLLRSGRAEPVEGGRCFVSVGSAFPDSEFQIIDPVDGGVLPERREGEIVIRGPSVMQGYFNDPDSTAKLLREGWFHTGDLGYAARGELFVTGRLKAVLIRAGEKYHAEELEAAAETVPGVRRGCSAAFAVDRHEGENVALVVEQSSSATVSMEALARGVADMVERTVGLRPDRVHVVPPRWVPKTTSGKVKRGECRRMLLDGELVSSTKSDNR